MWIVIDIMGDCPGSVMIALDEDGFNRVFNTRHEAEVWAKENCTWDCRVVEI